MTGRHDVTHVSVRAALLAIARFGGVAVVPLSSVVDDLVELRQSTYTAYRTALSADGVELPADFGDDVEAVATFADPLSNRSADAAWRAAERRWLLPT